MANSVLMIEPKWFRFNDEAAVDNAFMNAITEEENKDLSKKVLAEFDGLVEALRSNGIHVERMPSADNCPDAVWPNNWIVTYSADEKKVFEVFSFKSNSRRLERNNPTVMEFLNKNYTEGKDWIEHEKNGKILEGTGSLVLDRVNKIAYVAESERSNPEVAKEWAKEHKYELVLFQSADANGLPIYHTNVVAAVGATYIVICMESIPKDDQEKLREVFTRTKKEVIDISLDQLNHFCGNVIELVDKDNKRVLVMSSQAFGAFTDEQKNKLRELGVDRFVHSDISTLERIGGGSARCMVAELY